MNPDTLKKPEEIIKLQEKSSNFFEDLMHENRENPLLGRLYALFIFSPHQYLKQGDLAETLNVSVSTISRNLKKLEEWDIINRRLIRKSSTDLKQEKSKDKWEYSESTNSSVSFIKILRNNHEETAETIMERRQALERIREQWHESSEEAKESVEGKNIFQVLDTLINYMSILEEEYIEFLDRLENRFKESHVI
ncbi:MAG: winged helix-turn-helix transcriptional regulator [Candidatus Heimdallarchaeota archaeon]|nr:MAG: winged helix-turn-helix transcriptional regulator [Candidatus Heimdallarchaeota archaeon]